MSNTTLPAPLTPADCDLRDFPFMLLDVKRLRDSDMALTETPEACWAAVLLWCASWHQVPAGSLSDDDRVLANLAGYGRVVKEWRKHKAGALHGWVKCSDGRLYHKTVAEKANAAWKEKLAHHHGKLADRLRKINKAREDKRLAPFAIPSLDEWLASGRVDPSAVPEPSAAIPLESAAIPPESTTISAGIPPENALKGEGEGKGKVEGEGEKHTLPAAVIDPAAGAPDGAACVSTGIPTESATDSTGTAGGVPLENGDFPEPPPPANPKASMASAVCLALKAEGMASTNPSHPELRHLLENGATVDSFVQAARDMRERGNLPSNPFAYVIGTVKGQMQRASAMAATAVAGAAFAGQPGVLPTRPLNRQEALEARNREVGKRAIEKILAQEAAKNQAQGASYAN